MQTEDYANRNKLLINRMLLERVAAIYNLTHEHHKRNED